MPRTLQQKNILIKFFKNLILIFLLTLLLIPTINSFDYFDSTSKQKQNSFNYSNLLKSKINEKINEGGNNSLNNSLPLISNLKMPSNLENVNIEIQLRGYSNPDFRLPQGRLCTCPKGSFGEHCIQGEGQNIVRTKYRMDIRRPVVGFTTSYNCSTG
ncbi:unnamed protein product [Meloidogyne enterolobii]|uniref:Uncharacterized protein n=1 Tax=Meloidogyne enterolobii TaxID=390850 RepID=A0ACB0YVX9_MELEN